ncbi:PIG-L family deacetylase (plasmid) [Streptomyces sp. BI20]|uniref:PIG-L family deacetylase n=1 Tax=Streptomyces sp. BI20 TaxID=3403460 RepID=UPI003C77E4FE
MFPLSTGPRPSRRTVVTGMALAGVAGLAACVNSDGAGPRPEDAPSPSKAPARAAVAADHDGTSGCRTLQILAHPDDDLYFMNPELEQSIDANDALVSVYLNCGESGGVNKVPGRPRPAPDVPGYAGARRQGLRQAYSLMATGRTDSPWRMTAQPLPDGTAIEVDTLEQHPGITLVFLGIRQHGGGSGPARARAMGLPDLWTNPTMRTSTLVSTGSPVTTSHPMDREGLIAALAHLLDTHRPNLIRILDPDPDMQVHDKTFRKHHDQAGYSDHPDHTAAALFALAALERYKGPGPDKDAPYAVVPYRGYYNERWPDNLPRELIRAKGNVLNAYGGSPDACTFTAGCGDYDVGKNRSYGTGWLKRTSLRTPAPPVVTAGPDGVLTAFAVLGGRPATWRETAKGSGTFDERPTFLGGDRLLPGLTALTTRDGRRMLFAVRVAELGPTRADNRRELVTCEQSAPGGPFGPWTSLGNPERDPDRGRRVGAPAVALDATGRPVLFTRDWSKRVVSRRREANGRWGSWTPLGGGEVQEGLSAVTDKSGRIHVFGSGREAVRHWAQSAPGGPFTPADLPLPPPADPPVAAVTDTGDVSLAYREAKTARVVGAVLPARGGAWAPRDPGLPARGYGAVALLPFRGGSLLYAARNNKGSASTAVHRTGAGAGAARWGTTPGPLLVGTPALVDTGAGMALLVHLTPSAGLHAARLK